MDFLASSLSFPSLQSVQLAFSLLFFSFTTLFSLVSLLIYIMRLSPWCSCEVCKSYLNSSWAKDFDNLCDWYTHLLKKSPTRTIHVHVLKNIITSNPENVEYMLKTNFHNYPKGKPFSNLLGDLLGRGIFNVDDEGWKFQRKMASLELGSVYIKHHAFDIITNEIESRLIPLLSHFACNDNDDEIKSLDLQDVFKRLSFDNICKFSFGLDPGCLMLTLRVSELATAFDLASTLSAQRALCASPLVWKFKRMFNLGSERKLKESINVVKYLAKDMINQRRKLGFSNHKDLLSRFMGSIEDDEYLRDIVVSFLLAGRDTVASGLTSLFWLLSQHPEIVSKVNEELDQVTGQFQGKHGYDRDYVLPRFQQIREMHYLNAVVHESLRLFPPVQFDSKFTLEDDVFPDGTFVQAGRRVTYHQYAMGRMDQIWGSDSLEFKPQRWLKNGIFVSENPFKYPVFHAGFRVCLGKEMALVEMKSVVLAIVQRFKIRVCDPDLIPKFTSGLTATVRGGLPVVIEERETPTMYSCS